MNTYTIHVATELGMFLSSRQSAGALRRRVEAANEPVQIDFSVVQSISDTFADEFFAVLVQNRGHEFLPKTCR
ncbi:MAG: DUF4325 domain-containing protein [Planctomycetaceae bacterium]|nr:MAG: DUF4325 domain-containing protein [Planctomycetaceae bacterium]